MKDAYTSIGAAIIGLMFGMTLQRSGASDYYKLTGMLTLKDLDLLKLMMTAIGTASIGIYMLSMRGINHFTIKPLKTLMMTVGGLIFGAGFALNGYCPGTGLVAMAERKSDAALAVAGGIMGTLAYAFLEPVIEKRLDKPDYGKITVDQMIKKDTLVTSVIYGLSMISAAFIIDMVERHFRKKSYES